MMLFNLIWSSVGCRYQWIGGGVEIITCLILFYTLPFSTVYLIHNKKEFLLGEGALLVLSFIYISAMIPASSLSYFIFDDYFYDGNGKVEVVSNPKYAMQIVFDDIVIIYVQKCETRYIAWVIFSISGIVALSVISVVAAIVIAFICLLVLRICCSAAKESCNNPYNYMIRQGYKAGETFTYDGIQYKVVEG